MDRELNSYRRVMEPPVTFEDGFNWTSFLGALFIGLLMVPGAVYMGLLAGEGVGPAARWVTVILFVEIARRAQRNLKNAEAYVLFYIAGAAMAMPFGGLLFHQFYIRSDAAAAYGIAKLIPNWYAPSPESNSYIQRTFLHKDWLPAIGLIVFQTLFGRIKYMILGYGFFRLTSDIERLPFPMAPVGASGVMALAEDTDKSGSEGVDKSWKWRVFSIGSVLGLAFGAVYLLLPTLTATVLDAPITLIPIPFVEWSQKTSNILPAVATGINFNILHFFIGMVLPFFAVIGKVVGTGVTFILNPVLYNVGVLKSWVPGDDTVATTFKNSVDFYFSFTIGISIAVALVGFVKVFKVIVENRKKRKKEIVYGVYSKEYLKKRGDIPVWGIIAAYFIVTMIYILVCGWLIDWHRNVMIVLLFLGFVYTPFISYVTARLEGIAGMAVQIPYIAQACMILSGYQGVKVWFLPIPTANYGDNEVVVYRQSELTGTKLKSLWKTEFIITPIILVATILYMSYIWGLAEVPSAAYPFANRMWELRAARLSIMYSSTLGGYSIFEDAFRLSYLLVGTGAGFVLFGVMSWLSAPVFLTYGIIQGLGGNIPHALVLQFAGALAGRLYFRRKMGLMWKQYAPVVTAGFACGMGLIATAGVGISFLSKAVINLPF